MPTNGTASGKHRPRCERVLAPAGDAKRGRKCTEKATVRFEVERCRLRMLEEMTFRCETCAADYDALLTMLGAKWTVHALPR